jgi:hypothetical protein
MKKALMLYVMITLGYWVKLIWTWPVGYVKSYLLGRAIVWPFIFLQWIFS